MKLKKQDLVLILLTLAVAFISWLVVDRAIIIPTSSTWFVPMIWFSLFFIIICLNIILTKGKLYTEILFILSLLFSFIFVFNIIHLIIILFSALLLVFGLNKIKKDLKLNIKVDLRKSVHTGKNFIIVALALIITSQYYFTVSSLEGNKKIPHFEMGDLTGKATAKILSTINPSFAALQNENITVDEFILQNEQLQGIDMNSYVENSDVIIEKQLSDKIPEAQKQQIKNQARAQMVAAKSGLEENNKELILKEGRKQLSQIAGNELNGNEKMSDVLSGLVENKMNSYFSPSVDGGEKSNAFSFISSMVLLLTILPMASFLSYFWIWAILGIFKIMLKSGVVSLRKEMVEVEVIE